jgi:hypothetical protein
MRGYNVVALCRILIANASDMMRDAKNFLRQHQPTARRTGRMRLVCGQNMSVSRIECDEFTCHFSCSFHPSIGAQAKEQRLVTATDSWNNLK